jgi:hypothetical protein
VKWYRECLFHLVELAWKWPIGPDQLTKFFVHLQTAHRCADATYAMRYRAARTWLNWRLEHVNHIRFFFAYCTSMDDVTDPHASTIFSLRIDVYHQL